MSVATTTPEAATARLEGLRHAIDHAAHLLPNQGPITVFIHHNTLHAFEDLPFHEAVAKAARVYGCEPYLTEERYRDELARGRILPDDLHEALVDDLGPRAGEPIPAFGSVLALRLAMLQYPVMRGPTEELLWYVAEADALRKVRREVSSATRGRLIAETRRWVVRDLRGGAEPTAAVGTNGRHPVERPVSAGLAELLSRFGAQRIESWSAEEWEGFTLKALWRVCCDGVRDQPCYAPPPPSAVRHRDLLLEATGVDPDAMVHDLLIRFCAAYLDQGMAQWSLPRRAKGFLRCFAALYSLPGGLGEAWTRGLAPELARLDEGIVSPLESIAESLENLGVADAEREEFLSATLLALRGWAGMVRQVEMRGDRVVQPVPAGSLDEFLAVRLLLDRFALAHTARTMLGIAGAVGSFWRLARGRTDMAWPPSVEQRAFAVFQLAQVVGLSPEALYRLDKAGWSSILREVETFTGLDRRRVFQTAYERRLLTRSLDALAIHAPKAAGRPPSPRFQAIFCIDDREESLRRHIEELAPDVETLGVVGFFAVPMYYRGAGDAHYTPLCPVVIVPKHWVTEEDGDARSSRRRAATRRALGKASHQVHLGSRGVAAGALLSGAVGVFASIPLVARILFPRLTARFRQAVGRIVRTPPETHLHLERAGGEGGPEDDRIGFTVEEMTATGAQFLGDLGLKSGFARLVLLIGHGSNSLNNPYNSAYNCGACGGGAGGPNARALAQILNDPRVREGMRAKGIDVPESTVFVGGYHNTCNESVIFFDTDHLPDSHRAEFLAANELVQSACERNAHERCRRFMSAPLSLSYTAARQHVEGRAEDLAQTRPELGHATNSLTVVGRREWSRGLFLDRRAFLTSYDPSLDDAENSTLMRILDAVFPVCSGINLEYYFSRVDNVGFGSGSKLPHNLSALLGVMDGAASDLRTGLPWQMVEVHEPVRSLFLIETTPEAMARIMEQNPGIGRLCRNDWVKLSLLNPTTAEVSVFEGGTFRPYKPRATALPQAASSADWYRGWRDHLEFAEIGG